jgi:hypothetical protein
MPDINYKILAQFLKLISYDHKNWKELVLLFRKNRFHVIIEQTNKYLAGDKEEILREIQEDLGPDHAPVIIKLLTEQQPKIEEMNQPIPLPLEESPEKLKALSILEKKMNIIRNAPV